MDLSLIPRVFLLAALALTASTLTAAPPPPDPQEQEQIQDGLSGPELKESPPPVKEQRPAPIRENLLDRPHDFLSRSVEAYSWKLDNFFSDPNRAYDSTGSTLQIRSHVTFFEGGVRESKADIHANISLPNTSGWRSARRRERSSRGRSIPTFGCAPSATSTFRNGRSERIQRDPLSDAESGNLVRRPPSVIVAAESGRGSSWTGW